METQPQTNSEKVEPKPVTPQEAAALGLGDDAIEFTPSLPEKVFAPEAVITMTEEGEFGVEKGDTVGTEVVPDPVDPDKIVQSF